MDFHELIINRRSIRKYTDEPIAQEDVRLILEAALLSPTSKSARAWQLVAIEDKSTLEQLAACKPAGAMSVARAFSTMERPMRHLHTSPVLLEI